MGRLVQAFGYSALENYLRCAMGGGRLGERVEPRESLALTDLLYRGESFDVENQQQFLESAMVCDGPGSLHDLGPFRR